VNDEKLDFSKPEELQTRNGRPVRIYATDGGGGYPVHGATLNDGVWLVKAWKSNGLSSTVAEHQLDIISKPKRITGWMNAYLHGNGIYAVSDLFESQIEARKASAPGCLGQIYVDAEIQK